MRVCLIILISFINLLIYGQETLVDKLDFSLINVEHDGQFYFTDNPKRDFFEDKKGNIFIPTKYGLFKFNGHIIQDVITSKKNDFSEILSDLDIRQITKYKSNFLLGTKIGLFEFNPETYQVKKHNIAAGENKMLKNEVVSFQIKDDILFYQSYIGLWLYDLEHEVVLDSFLTEGALNTDPSKTNVKQSYLNLNDWPNSIWGAYAKGYFQIDYKTKIVETFQYDYIKKHDPKGYHFLYFGTELKDKLWTPSYWYGMMEIDKSSKVIKHHSIVEVKEGERSNLNLLKHSLPYNDSLIVVCATYHGVGVFNVNTLQYQFHKTNAKEIPILADYDQILFYDRHGRLFASSNTGIHRTKGKVIEVGKEQKEYLEIYLGKSQNRKIDLLNLVDQENINLNYNEYQLELKFGLINSLPKDIQYQYRLIGQDIQWKENGFENKVELKKLNKSTYQFEVRALHNNMIIAEQKMQINKEILFYQYWWFKLAAILGLLLTIGLLVQNRLNRIRDKKQLKLEFEEKLIEVEMSALRAQMNPHFLFNSLNSIKYFAYHKDKEETGDYINKFALLVRAILNNSKTKTISLKQEIKTIKLYTEIEKIRFEKEFEFEFKIDDSLDQEEIQIPPMLIQPFIENAIWHGLMHKEGKGKLTLGVFDQEDKILIEVLDNGIGRNRAQAIKNNSMNTKSKSLGMQITSDRMSLIEKSLGIKAHFLVKDLQDQEGKSAGTRVQIVIPKLIEDF